MPTAIGKTSSIPNGDYAQCYWDAKHVLTAYAVYDLPFGKENDLDMTCQPR